MDSARQQITCETRNARIEDQEDIRHMLSEIALST